MENHIHYTPKQEPQSLFGMFRLIGLPILVLLLMALAFWFYPEEMPGRGWRYVFLPPVVLILLLAAGVRYVRRTYHLRRLDNAVRYLLACLFGIGYPSMTLHEDSAALPVPAPAPAVNEDEDDEDDDEDEAELELERKEQTLEVIGGPGYIHIPHHMAALVEHYQNSFRVLGPGRYFISRNETIKERAGLQESRRYIEKLTVMSEDGIEVVVQDINYRYRMCLDDESGSNVFSEDGVINRAYNRNAGPAGIVDWHDAVRSDVEGMITDYIRTNSIDYLIAPKGSEDPRMAIARRFHSPDGREKLRKRGAYLTWIDIGVFTTLASGMAEERVNAWVAGWQGRTEVAQAQGQAQRQATLDRGRLDVQKNMLQQIIQSLESQSMPGDTGPTLRKLYMMRLAQLLETLRDRRANQSPMKEK